MTTDRLREIEAMFEAATPGPWEVWDGCSWRRIGMKGRQTKRPIIEPIIDRNDGHPDLSGPNREADLEFMAHSWANIAYLLDLVAAMREVESRVAPEQNSGCGWCDLKYPVYEGQHIKTDYHRMADGDRVDCTKRHPSPSRDQVIDECAQAVEDLVGASESMLEAAERVRALKSPPRATGERE